MELDVGDVLPLLPVAAIITLTRLALGGGLLAPRLTSAAARRTQAARRGRRIPSVGIDAVVDFGLIALAVAHLGVVALLFVSAVGALP